MAQEVIRSSSHTFNVQHFNEIIYCRILVIYEGFVTAMLKVKIKNKNYKRLLKKIKSCFHRVKLISSNIKLIDYNEVTKSCTNQLHAKPTVIQKILIFLIKTF